MSAAQSTPYNIDGVDFTVSVNGVAYAATGEKVQVTVTVAEGTATAGSVDATVTAGGGGTVDNGVAVSAASNITLGTNKLTTTATGAVGAGRYTFDVTLARADISISIV